MDEIEDSEDDSDLTWTTEDLYDADPDCVHDVQSAPGGSGVKCTKCNGWFCY